MSRLVASWSAIHFFTRFAHSLHFLRNQLNNNNDDDKRDQHEKDGETRRKKRGEKSIKTRANNTTERPRRHLFGLFIAPSRYIKIHFPIQKGYGRRRQHHENPTSIDMPTTSHSSRETLHTKQKQLHLGGTKSTTDTAEKFFTGWT